MGITKIEARYESAYGQMLNYIIRRLEYYNFALACEDEECGWNYLNETNKMCRLFDSMFNCKSHFICNGMLVCFLFVNRNRKKEKYLIASKRSDLDNGKA